MYLLAKHLARRGHEVHLYASSDSVLPEDKNIRHIPFCPNMRGMGIPWEDTPMYELEMIEQVIHQNRDADIIHNHLGYQLLPFASLMETPMVTTLHGALNKPRLKRIHRRYGHLPFVSISDFQRTPCPDLNFVKTIHHGLELDRFEYDCSPDRKNYATFLGRISPEKGVHHAIRIAKEAGMRLVIAGKIDSKDEEYYRYAVKPHLDGRNILFIGEVNHSEKVDLLKNAYVTICAVTWPEPFGLVLAESMACGTPVLALKDGSIPEVVADGRTGYVRGSVDELCGAFRLLDKIRREDCRRHAERYFSVKRMIDDYETLFERLAAAPSEESASGVIYHEKSLDQRSIDPSYVNVQ